MPALSTPVLDPALKERERWLKVALKKVQATSLGDAQRAYGFLLDDGKTQPEALLVPVKAALDKARRTERELQEQLEEQVAREKAEVEAKEAEKEAAKKVKEEGPTAAAAAAAAAVAVAVAAAKKEGEMGMEVEEGGEGGVEGVASTTHQENKEGEEGDGKEGKEGKEGGMEDEDDMEEGAITEAKSDAAMPCLSSSPSSEAAALALAVVPPPTPPPVVLKRIDPMNGVPIVEASRTIQAKLHEHQVEGLSWLVHQYRNAVPAILGDQMGLGKTLQSIAFLAYLKDNMQVSGPHLVVVPLSVMSNWMAEIERFCPSMRCIRFHGPKQERARIKQEELTDVREFDVVVTTYEMLTSEISYFRRKFFWRVLIVDEGHRLKNEKSQLSENLRKLPAFYRLILTGTPCQNNLRELWALFHYLLPDVFTNASAEKFEEGFDAQRGIMDVARMKEARSLLALLMLRRRKDQISMTLPSKTELAVVCGLSEYQRTWYKRVLTGVRGEILTTGAGAALEMADGEWRKLLNILLQLRKVCNHPFLMSDSVYTLGEDLVEASGKLKVLDRMLPKMKADGHRVLLFSQFTSMLDILEDYCQMRGHEYVRLDGSTNRVQRRLDMRRFNAPGSNLFIFLISTRAGGVGINLASADTVVLYDSDWNPQVGGGVGREGFIVFCSSACLSVVSAPPTHWASVRTFTQYSHPTLPPSLAPSLSRWTCKPWNAPTESDRRNPCVSTAWWCVRRWKNAWSAARTRSCF